jgi:hypothetical protein
MSSLTRFLKAIASRTLLTPARMRALEQLDPSHIYVENVRAMFGLSTRVAERLCEFGVKQQVLRRRVEVLCPDRSVAAEADTVEELPPEVNCWEDEDSAPVERTYLTARMPKVPFYVLNQDRYS